LKIGDGAPEGLSDQTKRSSLLGRFVDWAGKYFCRPAGYYSGMKSDQAAVRMAWFEINCLRI
jgi:hypothetical protein